MRDLVKADRYLKTVMKLEDVLEEQKPYLLSFKVLLTWCMRVASTQFTKLFCSL